MITMLAGLGYSYAGTQFDYDAAGSGLGPRQGGLVSFGGGGAVATPAGPATATPPAAGASSGNYLMNIIPAGGSKWILLAAIAAGVWYFTRRKGK
jgi:hypothetical protein